MDVALDPESPKPSGFDSRPRVRLAFGRFYWRTVLTVVFMAEYAVATRQVRLGRPPLLIALKMLGQLREILPLALGVSLAVAGILALLVRLIVRPIAEAWASPRLVDNGVGSFHLEARETVLNEVPGQFREGRKWVAGTLTRTNLRLRFFPKAFDREPWALTWSEIVGVRLHPSPRILGGSVENWPPALEVRDRDGRTSTFVVGDPETVLGWFGEGVKSAEPRPVLV